MYLTGQHPIVPDASLVSEVTHVALAFMRPKEFNREDPEGWPLFTTVREARKQFAPGTAIMVAVGGWGDVAAFEEAAATEEGRKLFAGNVKKMLDETGADGIDIDWEYPGGNGEDYKQVPNSQREWEIEAYPLLLSEIRRAVGKGKLLSAAVPGLRRDMLAFTNETIPAVAASLDFFNIMTYDLMNRRDNITKHHTGIGLSLDGINAYIENGVHPHKANLGFAFYLKWFKTAPDGGCEENPIGCKTPLMEDPETGADLGQGGGFSWHDGVPSDVEGSFRRAMAEGKYDSVGGGHYYWDEQEDRWWTWDTPEAIDKKFPAIVEPLGLGGVFAWGLGEDGDEWAHLRALTSGVRSLRKQREGLSFQGDALKDEL